MKVPYKCPSCGTAMTGTVGEPAACPACGNECTVPDVGIVPGAVLGSGFRIDRELGHSALGTVYLAWQESMTRQVQVKVLDERHVNDPEARGRFEREVRLTAALNNEHLQTAIEAGEDAGYRFLVIKHCPGTRLSERLGRGAMPERPALDIALDIAEALAYAWERSELLHRNVTPENIIVGPEGGAVLTDLGVAKPRDTDTALTAIGFTVGTPTYMSPEQCQAEDLDFRADMYSLGVVLYEMLAGTPPFVDPSPLVVMQQHCDRPPPPLPESVSPPTARVVGRMLAKAPGDRFGDWPGAIKALKKARRGDQPAESKPKPAAAGAISRQEVEQMARQMYRVSPLQKALMYVLSVILAAGISWGIWWVLRGRHQEPAAPRPVTVAPGAASAPSEDVPTPAALQSVAVAPEPAVELPAEQPSPAEPPSTTDGDAAEAEVTFAAGVDQVALAVARGRFGAARLLIEEMTKRPPVPDTVPRLAPWQNLLAALAEREALLAASFRAECGQTVRLQVGEETVQGTLERLNGSTLEVMVEAAGGRVRMARRIPIAALPPAELQRRLAATGHQLAPLLAAVTAIEAGDPTAAQRYLETADGALPNAILEHLQ